ncbi:PREDICTED: hydrocephalus-inducing protein homolog [Trachymyrmex septentrionalis]|uniref:hydrocephalus-inducing protein homolog n=1 Tax=Trachymyrmex septentrionalis TaxID=34720 RepID=UPI00084F59CA|nr:PREDICTED: hydrocephalus-inducing protein homolog [Trachymyrmex septentrionalis]
MNPNTIFSKIKKTKVNNIIDPTYFSDVNIFDFGSLLVYEKDQRSPIKIFWQLEPNEPLDPQISITPTKGIIKTYSDKTIEFCYHANKIGMIEESLTFKVFFYEGDTEPIFIETITLFGETYDVAVDINYANPIDLKCVKVGFPTSANFTLSNRGNHEVKYATTQKCMLKIGPFTVTKTEGDLQPGEIDIVAIECYPEFVGSEEEDIIIFVPDSVPEDRNGKLIKLSVNSCIPSVNLQDLDAIFHENHIVNHIEDFICSKEIGTYTIFARQEKCLYFRYVSVFHTHTAYLVLYNRNVIPADVKLTLLADSFTPKTMRPDTFVLIPERERIQSMSHKRFAISFNPTFIETCYAIFDIAVELPLHLKDEKFFIKLVGQACVPEVTIIEPLSTKRERTVLNFGRTLTCLECIVCAIQLANSVKESSWDDRETQVRWITINSDAKEPNAEIAKKTVEPVNEPEHEIVPGTTKCIQVLLNAIVAFSKYSCSVKEINFKNTLMFQTSEHSFIFANTGIVDVEYTWQINMDEQYPVRSIANYSQATSRSRKDNVQFKATSLMSYKLPYQRHNSSFDKSVKSNRRQLLSSRDNFIEVKPTTRCGPSDLFSSSARLTERSSDSWLESDDLPFEIYPEKGILPPGESVECVLRFSPMDIFDYKAYLVCKMENLELPELIIPIVGKSLLPYCHFDIPESDYLSSNRRDMKLPGPIGYQPDDNSLPEGTRVIELDVIGISGSHIKKFRMINPTSDDYHFIWEDRTRHADDEISKFHCALPEGIAERGKQVDFAFTFFAENIGTFESFWLFRVKKYNLEYLFLFVATVREPLICCPRVHLKMRPTVMGVNVRESISIINKEEFQIPFQITRDSLYSEGRLQNLKITPISGILPAKGEQILWVEYQPTLVGEFQFCVKCIIKGMMAPLTIFVTTATYDIIVSVTYVDQNGQIVQLNPDKENIIDCGKLLLKTPVTVVFEIINSSKMTLYYSWDLGITSEIISRNMYTIAMPQKQDHVLSKSRSICSLIVTALQKTVIKNHPILLKISRGPTYRLILKATANKPILEFSFNYYDFGPCYIRDVSATPYHVDLRITNSDDVSYILECKFEEKPHISVNLNAISKTIVARSSIVIPITFRPLEQVHYRDDLHFIINSTIKKKITIIGEGIIYKIRLVNPRDKSVDLGSLSINKTTSRKVPVINDGRAALKLKFDLIKNLPGYDLFQERIPNCPLINQENSKMDRIQASISETKRSNTLDETLQMEPNLSQVLEIEPAESIVLQPGKIVNVVVKYKPIRRMRPFVVKVAFQTNSTIQPLFILRGSCIGAKFHLNKTYVPFGIVVQGCLSEAKIVLLNMGDIGARFKWNTLKLPEDFNIAPATGYCSPGMNVNFVVSFQPTRHDSLIEGNGTLLLKLPDDKAPLVYCLRGLSLPPQVLQRITRQFPAKTKYTELLPVYNWLSRQQQFECQIENMNGKESAENVEMFTFVGSRKIDIPANGQRDYRAEFYSYKESKYNFMVTFTNEEGEYQFYELQYDITRPQEIESIKLITVVRSPVCYALKLDNPLKKQYVIYTAKCQHPCITIHDVPKLVAPLCSEIIKIKYHPLHSAEEITVALDVNCEELGLFPYELRLRAIPASPEKTTRVDAMLGSSVTFSLNVNNHAENTAIFTIKVDNECFTTSKDIEVLALKNRSFDITYEPCDVKNVSATLTATSEIAGEFVKIVTRFHPIHGENILLCEDSTVAVRTTSFANSVAFSEKPLQPGEIFLVEIEKTERGWSGHMRLGLTLIDPASVNNNLPQYAMPNLVRLGNTWILAITRNQTIWDNFDGGLSSTYTSITGLPPGIPAREKKLVTDGVNVQTSRGVIPFNALKPNIDGSSQCILPTDAGSRIGIMYVPQAGCPDKAEMHFIINGEDQGVCGKDIPYKAGPLRAVVDVYGTTKQVRIVQLYGVSTLQSACRDAILQYTKRNAVNLLPLPRLLKDYLLYQSQ